MASAVCSQYARNIDGYEVGLFIGRAEDPEWHRAQYVYLMECPHIRDGRGRSIEEAYKGPKWCRVAADVVRYECSGIVSFVPLFSILYLTGAKGAGTGRAIG